MQTESLAAALERAAERGEGRGFRFVKNDKWKDSFLTFAEIEQETARIGGALQELGLRKGERAALILPDTHAFVVTFLGALRAGIVPVPIYPPSGFGQLGGYLDNTRHIVAKSGAKALITSKVIKPLLGTVQASSPALETVATFSTLQESNARLRPAALGPDDIAFLQFTSGSTSRPKGVVLTHGNLLANIRNIIVEGLRIDPTVDSAMTWLPLFHDMGLIGFVLAPVVGTIQTTFMSPLVFLMKPASWLEAMSHYQATMSFGPNFSYALCVKRVRERELEGVDLSGWRVAGCGAEPIRGENLEAFADKYEKLGFRKESFYPAYGLAESTLAVSFARGVPTDRVKASVLWSEGRAEPTESTDDSLRIVSCGPAFENHEIGVFAVDDASCETRLPDRVVGELRLHGASVSQGYFEDPELTKEAFVDGWFRTGDLGYLADGQAHVCGRLKEIVIVHGRNFHPQDIEWEASQVPGVRKGNVIAFGTLDAVADCEKVVLALESGAVEPAERERIEADVRARILEVIGIALDEILVLSPGTLPKTSSGKLQRTKTRQLHHEGLLAQRVSVREADRVEQVKHVARSQFHYLKLAVLGRKKKDDGVS